MQFPCIQCGLCCKKIGLVLEGSDENFLTTTFPYKWDKNGRCEKLTDEGLCSVYNYRPLICNVSAMAEELGVDEREFYNTNIKVCNSLLEQEGLEMQIKEV